MKKKKKYQTKSRYNPVIQAERIEKLKEKVEYHNQNLKSVIKSYDRHVEYLSNFAQHDMKNAIQSMDSILSTTEAYEFNNEIIVTLKTYLKVLRETINNFAKLVPHSQNGEFHFNLLMIAVELLTRNSFEKNEVKIEFKYNRDLNTIVNQPFQTLLQVIINLVLNSVKALENCSEKSCMITGDIIDNFCVIVLKDSGVEIPEINRERIFEYGYSSTGGTGIGLYHAKYVCEEIGGDININLCPENSFTKEFIFKFPINNISHEKKHSDN